MVTSRPFLLLIGLCALMGHVVEAFELNKPERANALLSNFENPIIKKYLHSRYGDQAKSKRVSKIGKPLHGADEIDGFVVSGYYGDAECSSTVAGVTSGTATGICYTVTDLSDNSTSGVIFRYESETNGLLYLNSLQYSDGECQNYVQNGPFPIVEGCEKFENGWMSVAYTTDKTPWDQFPPGLFELYYDTIDHCKEGGVYGQFVHYTLNYCFPGEPLMLTQCNGGKYTFAEFVDDECHNSDFSYTSSLKLCESVEYDDDAKTTEMFYTQECKEKW